MIKLPYGSGFLELDEKNAKVIKSGISRLRGGDGGVIVRAAVRAPIESPRLQELAKGKRTCTVIISDHTRPVPSRDILPPMLEELKAGSPDIKITLLVATGFHRGTTTAELKEKLGAKLFEAYPIIVHDCNDTDSNVKIGILPSGAELMINRTVAETELLIAEGFIEPHFFAGYSGGRKSVLPGVCGRSTVLGNHCSGFIDSPYARTGVLEGNPIHADMLAAMRMARLAFIVNVIIDEKKRTVAAFAGDAEQAHLAGCDFLRRHCAVPAAPADIVVTTNGGAPLDQNIYQCVKSMTAAEATANEGAVIIVCAQCADGAGGESFYRSLKDCESPAALYKSIMKTSQERTIPDQWESQILARVLMKHNVILVTEPELEPIVRDMKMEYAPGIEEALKIARREKGTKASLTVIPDGISVIIA